MSTANTKIAPPAFGPTSENLFAEDFDLDLDFKLLSEYLFDDNVMTQQAAPKLTTKVDRRVSARDGDLKIKSHLAGITDIEDVYEDNLSDDDIREKNGPKNGKTRQRVDKRRERNRVLARKTRLRKKFFFESLQRQVAQLTKENEMLKSIATTHLKPETVEDILKESAELPQCVVSSTQHANSILEKADMKLISAIRGSQRSFCITDPSLPDNPIVFASPGFLELTGYTMEQVLGKNCRFLQGPRTDPGQIGLIRQGLIEGKDISVCFINYKADGTEFYNQLFIAGLRDANHELVNYVGVLAELDKRSPSEDMMLDESLGRPAKKGRPRLKDKEDRAKNTKSHLLPMPASIPSELRKQQQQEYFRNLGNTSLMIPQFSGIRSRVNNSMDISAQVTNLYNQSNEVQDTVPELNYPFVDFTEITNPSWTQS